MHDPQEDIESGKENLKKQEGLEPAAKDTWAEVAKVSCSHAHMLSQPCCFRQVFVLYAVACCEPSVFFFLLLSQRMQAFIFCCC